MAAKVKLWGAGTARTLRPIWMAEELGLDYALHPIGPRTGETQTAKFTAMTRKQKVPFMVDGEVKLSESVAICRYLQAAYPSEKMPAPPDMAAQAKADEWCCYIYGEIDETALYVIRRHGDLTDIYGAAPEVVKATEAYLKRHFAVLEAHLKTHETLTACGFDVADILLVSCLDWAVFYGLELPPAVQGYLGRMSQRPAYQKSMEINYKSLMEALDATA